MMGAVTPETCRVALQYINVCILLHLVGFLLILNYDARKHELRIYRFKIYVTFSFLYFDLFQVKAQLVSKVNGGLYCYLFFGLLVLILA